ncbi:hypothetical protein BH09PAT1_BH09PAT1_8110 [soil metagenome]
MELPKRGCSQCRTTDSPLNQYSFANLLGQKFILFVCSGCIMVLSDDLHAMSLGEQTTYLTNLGQIINSTRTK